jgi:VanZ family protein
MDQSVCRAAAWTCALTLAYFSLVPPTLKAETGAPGQINHALAYFVTGAALAWAYPRAGPMRTVLLLVAYGCGLELLQNLVPGRSPKLIDAASSGVGAAIGVLLGVLLTRLAAPTRACVRISSPQRTTASGEPAVR